MYTGSFPLVPVAAGRKISVEAFVATSNASQSENKAEGKEKNELNLFLTTRLGRLAGLLLHFPHRWRVKKERKPISDSRWKKISQQFQLKTPEQRLVWFALLFTFFFNLFPSEKKGCINRKEGISFKGNWSQQNERDKSTGKQMANKIIRNDSKMNKPKKCFNKASTDQG